jgi:hypothetical protein
MLCDNPSMQPFPIKAKQSATRATAPGSAPCVYTTFLANLAGSGDVRGRNVGVVVRQQLTFLGGGKAWKSMQGVMLANSRLFS